MVSVARSSFGFLRGRFEPERFSGVFHVGVGLIGRQAFSWHSRRLVSAAFCAEFPSGIGALPKELCEFPSRRTIAPSSGGFCLFLTPQPLSPRY